MSKLKIIYQGEANIELDKDIEKTVKKYDYKFIGSGYDFRTKERDLAYVKS